MYLGAWSSYHFLYDNHQAAKIVARLIRAGYGSSTSGISSS